MADLDSALAYPLARWCLPRVRGAQRADETVVALCGKGEIPGARKVGRLWLEERRVEPARRLRSWGIRAIVDEVKKALKLDGATARTYADALGGTCCLRWELFYDQVTTRDVQAWLDDAILNGCGPRALTGHVTEQMQRHYSHVSLDEEASRRGGVSQPGPASGWRARWGRTEKPAASRTQPADCGSGITRDSDPRPSAWEA